MRRGRVVDSLVMAVFEVIVGVVVQSLAEEWAAVNTYLTAVALAEESAVDVNICHRMTTSV
jgi:hypothetical protein